MLETIHISNFRSIAEIAVNLSYAEGKAPNGYRNLPTIPFVQAGTSIHSRVCPVLALYGANASGKTSILLGVYVLIQSIKNGFSPQLFAPNRLVTDGFDDTHTSIGLVFWNEGEKFEYSLAFGKMGIFSECLTISDELVYSVEKGKPLKLGKEFSSSRETIEAQYHQRCVNAGNGVIVKTFLHEISQALPGLSIGLLAANEYLTDRILIFLTTDMPFHYGIQALASTYPELTREEAEDAAFKEIGLYLSRLDTQIVDLRMQRKGVEEILNRLPPEIIASLPKATFDKFAYSLQTGHQASSGKIVYFDINEESEGSKKLVGLLGCLLAALKTGKTVLVDELDRSLHGLLVRQIVSLYKDKEENKRNSQLIFTMHNTDLLDSNLLGVSEVGILNLRSSQGTKISRLAEFNGVRNCSEFRRRYLRGDFGGIPFPHF